MRQRLDPQQRRLEIIEALWRLTLREGLGAVSFREVALEAGVSVTLVQYHFGTKAGLLSAAMQQLGARIVDRGLERMRGSEEGDRGHRVADASPDELASWSEDVPGLAQRATESSRSPRDVLHAALTGALPTDEGSHTDLLLFLTFHIASLTDPQLAGADLIGPSQWTLPLFAELVRMGQQDGVVDSEVDPNVAAAALVATMTGLGLLVVGGALRSDEAVKSMEHALDRLFCGTGDPLRGDLQPPT